MVTKDETPDLGSLHVWKESLMQEIEALRADLRAKKIDLAKADERLALVTKLIEVETRARSDVPDMGGEIGGTPPPTQSVAKGPKAQGLEDAVEEILRASGKPLHVSSIRAELLTQGVAIPGRGDDANIIVRLRRNEDRFTRTARGTYALAEWGIAPLKSKTRKRRRSGTR